MVANFPDITAIGAGFFRMAVTRPGRGHLASATGSIEQLEKFRQLT